MNVDEMQVRQHCLQLAHDRLPYDSGPAAELALAERYFRYLWDGETLPAAKIVTTTWLKSAKAAKPAAKRARR